MVRVTAASVVLAVLAVAADAVDAVAASAAVASAAGVPVAVSVADAGFNTLRSPVMMVLWI